MRIRRFQMGVLLGTLLASPLSVRADFALGEFPQLVQDQTPFWIFGVFATLLTSLFQALFGGLFGV